MQKVFVGLSGGVDSGTSAALLKSQGYDVTGVFIKIWQPEFIECTWREDRLDAMRVCTALSIPFREIDLSDEYKREVVDRMVADYQKGITPNPDVLCNEKIKFGAFLRWAIAEGADMVATGHYAQVGEGAALVRGIDPAKDQSYFLYRISEVDLSKTLFPVGGMPKSQVRELAAKFKLPNAEKHDSQGLCFIGEVTIADFLRRYITVEEGDVHDKEGNIVGRHDGAALYTIGQRHGFRFENTPEGSAHYITSIDTKSNTITVSPERDDAARASTRVSNVHWIGEAPDLSKHLSVQTRYHETPISAEISLEGDDIKCVFERPHIASPGQSLVIYDGDTCLGGGVICA